MFKEENPELVKARTKARYWSNREYESERHKRTYPRDKARIRASNIEWLAKNPNWAKEYYPRWYTENREKIRENSRRWAAENPDKKRASKRKRRARQLGSVGSYTESDWQTIVKLQKGRCADCKQIAKLEADHIIPLSRGGSDMAINIQGLCRSCNAKKWAHLPSEFQPTLFDNLLIEQ